MSNPTRPATAATRPVTQAEIGGVLRRLSALEKANAGTIAALASLVQGKGETSRGSVQSRRKTLAVIRETLGETHALYRQTLHAEARSLVADGQAASLGEAVAKLGGQS